MKKDCGQEKNTADHYLDFSLIGLLWRLEQRMRIPRMSRCKI